MIALSLPSGQSHGWGVAGDNIARALYKITEVVPVSNYGNRVVELCCPCFHAIRGPDFMPMNEKVFSNTRNVGYCFIEHNSIAAKHVATAKRYFDHVCAGSSWTTKMLRGMGIDIPVSTLVQGVDPDIFKPDESERPPEDKFVIFSGGKWEYRKGQDIVVAAFKRLVHKYKDMHLVAAWHNPWPETMRSMEASRHILHASFQHFSPSSFLRTTLALNGIPDDRVTLLPAIPNSQMASHYRACHVGLALSRCESGTNLPAMELAACGVPLIASSGTGHADIRKLFWSYPKCDEVGEDGWIEPNVDSIINSIEVAYSSRGEIAESGRIASEYVRSNLTWDKTAAEIMKVMEPA